MRGTRSSCSSKTALTERTMVGLRPQVCAGARVGELHGEAQLCARLSQAALHHVARAELPADRALRQPSGWRTRCRSARHTRRYEKRERPVTISSDSPSASVREIGVGPRHLNGRTATQNPSSCRTAPDPLAAAERTATAPRMTTALIAAPDRDTRCPLRAPSAPGARILLEAPPNRAAEVRRQIAPALADRRRRVAQDRRGQLDRRRALERPPAGRHLVEHHAEREDVGAVIDRAGPRPAPATCRAPCPSPRRRASAQRTSAIVGVAQLGRARRRPCARPKSSTFTRPSAVTITLAGFRSRCTMPFVMRGRERIGDRPRAIAKDASTGRPPSGISASSACALDQLHRQEMDAVGLLDRVDRDDVRVIERGDGAGLALEAGEPIGVARHVRGQHLQRDVASELVSVAR